MHNIIKQGQGVYLASSPDMRGSISHVHDDGFTITWNPFVKDRPDALALKVTSGFKRTRVRYRRGETKNIVLGTPEG